MVPRRVAAMPVCLLYFYPYPESAVQECTVYYQTQPRYADQRNVLPHYTLNTTVQLSLFHEIVSLDFGNSPFL